MGSRLMKSLGIMGLGALASCQMQHCYMGQFFESEAQVEAYQAKNRGQLLSLLSFGALSRAQTATQAAALNAAGHGFQAQAIINGQALGPVGISICAYDQSGKRNIEFARSQTINTQIQLDRNVSNLAYWLVRADGEQIVDSVISNNQPTEGIRRSYPGTLDSGNYRIVAGHETQDGLKQRVGSWDFRVR